MSPKITRHGGPTHKGDPPKLTRRSFGEALAAARAGQALPPAAESVPQPQSEPTTATVDSSPTDEQLADSVREWVRVDGGAPVTVSVGDSAGNVGAAEPPSSGDLITADGGTGPDGATDPDAAVPDAPELITEVEGGEQPSPGTSSSTSPRKRRTSSDGPKRNGRRRAPSTGNPSPPDHAADSTAGSAVEPTTTSGSDK